MKLAKQGLTKYQESQQNREQAKGFSQLSYHFVHRKIPEQRNTQQTNSGGGYNNSGGQQYYSGGGGSNHLPDSE